MASERKLFLGPLGYFIGRPRAGLNWVSCIWCASSGCSTSQRYKTS